MMSLAATLAGSIATSAKVNAQASVQSRTGQVTNNARRGRAKIGMRQARTIALAQVRGGRIKSAELERESGQLIYSFDIRARGRVKEVHVDAVTGKVLEVKDESAANEASEQRNERKGSAHRRPR
jgi:uncharacterized membrane protein YkoI